jgi:hypothetical protein
MILKKSMIVWFMLFAVADVLAVAPTFDLGDCQDAQTLAADDGYVPDLVISENCSDYGQIDWTGTDLNLTDLGEVQADEVSIGHGYVYVNSVTRPDLVYPAHIILQNLSYAYTPVIKKDNAVCPTNNCTSVSYNKVTGIIQFDVSEFSNYSVTGRQDFTVYSDTQAYLHGRVYDTVNLGSSYLNDEFHCIVMLFDSVQKNMIQTNPEKKKAGSVFSATASESELPEIKGYFTVTNGIGNVYYRDADIVAYNDFLMVIKCNSNSTELVYEEQITPQYKEPFKSAPARTVWLIQDMQTTIIVIVFAIILLALGWYIFISK